MIDHRASPGLSETAARKAGYDPVRCREGKLFEAATMSCSHCQGSVVKNPLRTRDRAYCQKCDHYICDACDAQRALPEYDHTPYAKLSDMVLESVAKGMTLGSPFGLLVSPENVVP